MNFKKLITITGLGLSLMSSYYGLANAEGGRVRADSVPTATSRASPTAPASSATPASITGSAAATPSNEPSASSAGQLFLRKCKPGEHYTVQTVDENSVELVCPSGAKQKKKETCYDQFNGNGFCLPTPLAKSYGLTESKKGLCPGLKQQRCYDTTGVPLVATTLKGLEQQVTDINTGLTAVKSTSDGLNDRIKTLEDQQLTDLELFAVTLAGEACRDDYTRIQQRKAGVDSAKSLRDEAEKKLSTYICESENTDQSTTDPTGKTASTSTISSLREYLLTKVSAAQEGRINRTTVGKLLADIDNANKDYLKALEDLTADVDNLKAKGCGYLDQKPGRKPEISATLYGMADFNGNLGAMFEADFLVPLSELLSVGAYLNGSLFSQETSDNYNVDLGTATENVTDNIDRVRYLGGGLVLELRPWEIISFYAKGGVAWLGSSQAKGMTILGDTKTIDDSDHGVVPEAAGGVNVKIYGALGLKGECGGNPDNGGFCATGLELKYRF